MFSTRPALALVVVAGCSAKPVAGFSVQRAQGAIEVHAPDGRLLLDIRAGGSRIATAQWQEHGLPMMRALALEFPEDAAGWPLTDEYMLGPFLLVAPVLAAGATHRLVHFPPGKWNPFVPGDAVQGPADLDVPAALGELPLYARAGALVPLFKDVPMSIPRDLARVDGSRTLLVFQGGDGSFTERDGTSYSQTGGKLTISSPRVVDVEIH